MLTALNSVAVQVTPVIHGEHSISADAPRHPLLAQLDRLEQLLLQQANALIAVFDERVRPLLANGTVAAWLEQFHPAHAQAPADANVCIKCSSLVSVLRRSDFEASFRDLARAFQSTINQGRLNESSTATYQLDQKSLLLARKYFDDNLAAAAENAVQNRIRI